MSVAPPRKDIHPSKKTSRSDKIISGAFGRHGLIGALSELGHSVDPRTPKGLLNAMAMILPGGGKNTHQMADDALYEHLGHSQFRPYHALNRPTEEGLVTFTDQSKWGGMTPHGTDIGYSHWGNNFNAIHGYSLPELLGLVSGKGRISHPKDARGYLHAPYVSNKGLRN